jgi:hypothetical protein
MKLKFKRQADQADAVRAVVDCFQGRPKTSGLKYAVDVRAESEVWLEQVHGEPHSLLRGD